MLKLTGILFHVALLTEAPIQELKFCLTKEMVYCIQYKNTLETM